MLTQDIQKRNATPSARPHSQKGAGHPRAAAPERVSVAEPHLCAGHRRPQGHDPGFGEHREGKKESRAKGGNVASAKAVGKSIADRAKAKGITKVVFDRGGYIYHGRVKAIADAAREAGLQF